MRFCGLFSSAPSVLSAQHFQQYLVPLRDIDLAQLTGQTIFVDATDLIEQYAPRFAAKKNFRATTERLSFAGRDNNNRGQTTVFRKPVEPESLCLIESSQAIRNPRNLPG